MINYKKVIDYCNRIRSIDMRPKNYYYDLCIRLFKLSKLTGSKCELSSEEYIVAALHFKGLTKNEIINISHSERITYVYLFSD